MTVMGAVARLWSSWWTSATWTRIPRTGRPVSAVANYVGDGDAAAPGHQLAAVAVSDVLAIPSATT